MEPAPQLTPVAPRPQLQYAEPPARPLELKPGRAPLDLRPRPSARPQLDLKYGPTSPAEAAAQRANPLSNPLNVVQPVVNNPLGYAPGKGLIGLGATLLQNATDPETFGVPTTPIVGLELPELPNANEFNADGIGSGPVTVEHIPNTYTGGQMVGVSYIVTGTVETRSTTNGTGGSWSSTTWQHVSTVGATGPIDGVRKVTSSGSTRYTVGYNTDVNGVASGLNIYPTGSGGSIRVYEGSFTSSGTVRWGRNAVVTNVTRRDGQPDTGGNPAPLQQGQTAPNRARNPYADPARLPSNYPEPGTRPKTPFLPVPTFRLPAIPQESPRFIPYEAPSEVELPEIRPARPGTVAPPAKFPAPVTVPEMPRELEDPDLDSPSRKLKPPFLPALPGTTPTEIIPPVKAPPIVVFVPPLRRGDCCGDEAIERESQRILDKLDGITAGGPVDCNDLCNPATMAATECQEVDGKLMPVSVFSQVTTLAQGLELLAAEIADIKKLLNPCPTPAPASVDPSVIASGAMTEGETVEYVAVNPEVREVELIVTGQIPSSLRLYDTTLSGEQQGKFGSICAAYPGVTGGHAPEAFHQWAWTRRTLLYLGEETRPGRKVRIYLRAGLSWVLYDTGFRK